MWLLIRKEETTESFSLSLTSFKSPQDRRGENDKAVFEPSPPSETRSLLPASCLCLQALSVSLSLPVFVCVCLRREIMGEHFLLKSLSATQKAHKSHQQERNLQSGRFVVKYK